ncbi:MAG: EamA family transporter [Euryarchaeota archaeon]|nr:EamA family transporter [Euryarchaeota archaeon]
MLRAVAIGVVCALLGSVGQIMLKIASDSVRFTAPASLVNKYLIVGLTLYGAATLLYIYALRGVSVSVLYPVISLSYVFVLFLGVAVLKERAFYWNYAGAFLVVLGVALIMKR